MNRQALGSRYELVDELGEGAMGTVWRTWDRVGERWVAAKVLRRELAHDPQIVGRFIQERAILLALHHPNIVEVHDLVVEGDALAIVMDLVEGTDLRKHLRDVGTLRARDAVRLTAAVLDALDAAHQQSCLHRDVKPDNVLLRGVDGDYDESDLLLTDFGIARLAQESTVQATGLLGTPGYMPPELFVQGSFSAASDVYAAGILLYELLGGRTPFSGSGTAHTVGFRHASVQPPRLPVAPALWNVLATMLAKDPTTRMTAAATAQALRQLPDEVLDAPRLEVQPAPEEWDIVQGTMLRAPAVQIDASPAHLDVGATNLHADRPAAAFAAPTSPPPSAPPSTAPSTPPSTPPRRRAARPGWVPWAAGAVALAAAAAVTLGVVTAGADDGGGDAPEVPVGVAAEASLDGDPLPTGLSIDREASYDPASSTVELTVTYSAGGSPLTGPFLEVLPAADGGECPGSISWSGAQARANNVADTGVLADCGWAVDVGQVPARGEVAVTARLPLELGVDSEEELQGWLEGAAEAGETALARQTSDDAYPVQRLRGVEVDVAPRVDLRTAGGAPVQYTLYPLWGGEPDLARPLLAAPVTGSATGVLTAVAGGLDGVELEGCSALRFSGDGLTVVASFTGPCFLRAQVGELRVSPRARFSVESRGS
ncbi:serine/threonine-protein kinase [Nocardioides kribbensis]|uniref:serine/threonine-protein kinase n=1 Tax=Nocardioides kribbensis TaxID=305517 RepID=UPI00187A9022|nr:serine/threonine-protein kinase [Nocardioides kribbensis]